MRMSSKMLLLSVASLISGAFFTLMLIDMSPPIWLFPLFFSLALFFIAGRFYGVAQGWWEIELRQDWRSSGEWRSRDIVGLLLFFGLGMKPDEVEKEGFDHGKSESTRNAHGSRLR